MAKREKTDRVQIGVRMREALRAKLEAKAQANDVSLNSEIVSRLEGSFSRERRAEEIRDTVRAGMIDRVGDENTFREMMYLGAIVATLQSVWGTTWRDDPKTCEQVVREINAFFRKFGPEGAEFPKAGLIETALEQQDDKMLSDLIAVVKAGGVNAVKGVEK